MSAIRRPLVRLAIATLVPLAMLGPVSCGGAHHVPVLPPSSATPASPLEPDVVWRLISISIGDARLVRVHGQAFTMTLKGDGSLAVRADCNQASAPYIARGNRLSVGTLASTRAYCSSAPMDGHYLELLGGENLVARSGDRLRLSSPRGTLRFKQR